MSKKMVIDGYNVLWTKEHEVYRGNSITLFKIGDKDLYDAHLWFHGNDYVVKKNHTDFSDDKINQILNQGKDE